MKFHTDTILAGALRDVLKQLEERVKFPGPVTVFLAGGMAVHLYTGARVTTDVDAEFAVARFSPPAVGTDVVLEDGVPKHVYLDTNYNPSFALLHENYDLDAIPSGMEFDQLVLKVLAPTDLAVSKIARFADHDREDIATLVRAGLTAAQSIEQRAEEALVGFVGDLTMLRLNLKDAVALARQVEAESNPSATPAPRRG